MSNPNHIQPTIGFIGAGNMSAAIIAGLIDSQWSPQSVIASNPSSEKLERLKTEYGICITQNNEELADKADILVLGVKPQKMKSVCTALTTVDLTKRLVISIAAGISTATIEGFLCQSHINQPLSIIRVMPNTPALVRQGASGMFASAMVSEQQKLLATKIFESIGTVTWLSDESLMDVVTAIAGSSPAYFFLMMETMIKTATEQGMTESDAIDLTLQAMKGAAILAQSQKNQSLAQLRKAVTSPGGTTAAALQSLKNHNFEPIITEAVLASVERGKELGRES